MTQAPPLIIPLDPTVQARTDALLHEHQLSIWTRTDRLFAGLMVFQWFAGIILAYYLSPRTWAGAVSQIHPHVWAAIFLGAAIIALPIYLALLHPGRVFTRHVIAIGQVLYSALLIHLGDGRVEMHFHVFGSLAFIAFYRDWRVLISATIIVAADHLLRGIFLPESVYGILNPSNWRWLEHAAWVIFEDIFLITSCLQNVREMRGIAERQALLEHSHHTVEDKVRERTQQLKDAQHQLLQSARSAGMAEIATSVLHNVGNVLNSVNVSVSLATTKVKESPIQNLAMAVQLIADHKTDLGHYLTHDQQGQQVPAYLSSIVEILSDEQKTLLSEMTSLTKNVEHIKQIVSVQQSHAKTTSTRDQIQLLPLVEDALHMNLVAHQGQIEIIRELTFAPTLTTDKHALLQILINLVSNAKHAVMENPPVDRRITVRTSPATRNDLDFLRIEVIDNGIGIEPANLTRIFNHGFTTKKGGHGFGLHASANAAKQLGGSLSAHSAGPTHGAAFLLEIPLNKEPVPT